MFTEEADFLFKMRAYMPPAHRQFLEALEKKSRVKYFGKLNVLK